MMLAPCIDVDVGAIMDLLKFPSIPPLPPFPDIPGFPPLPEFPGLLNPLMFINPLAPCMLAMATAGQALQAATLPLIAAASVPLVANTLGQFSNAVTGLCGGLTMKPFSGDPPFIPQMIPFAGFGALPQFKITTDFLSGQLSFFPANLMSPTLVPNIGVLHNMSYLGMLSTIRSSQLADNVLCATNIHLPCTRLSAIFGPLIDGCAAIIAPIIEALTNMITGILDNALSFITDILGFVSQILGAVAGSITALLDALFNAMRYGLALLLNTLKLDPCFLEIFGMFMGNALKSNLGIPYKLPIAGTGFSTIRGRGELVVL